MAKPTPPGVMRSNSRLKKDLLRLVTNTSRANKTTCSSPTPLSMTASASPARSFSMMTGKMKSIHRRHRSGDKPASPAKADVAITVTSLENRNSPTLGQERAALQEAAGESRSISDISEETVAPRHETFPVEDSTFEGLPEWRSDASSGYTLIDHDFLESAFGITMEDKGDSNGPQVIGRAENPSLDIAGTTDPVSNPELEDDTLSMEIPIQLGKDRRPKIQVTIPDKRPQRYASLPSQNTKMERRTGRNQEISDIVSPPSTTTRHRMDKGTATARLSIVSPLSVVEMPKPRRPFSAFSLEGMMTDMPQHASPPSKSATSNSSDDTGEHDDRLSSYSKRSSMSSIGSEAAMIKLKAGRRPSVPYPVPSPNGADVFESPPSRSKYRKCMKSSTSLNDRPRSPKRMESILSLNEKANRNKPLPPEPKLMDIAPLNVSGQSLSRTSSMRARSKVPPPLNVRDDSSTITPSRRSSKVAASLRSKYTPKDLDALDDAFQKTGSLGLHNLSYTTKSTPSLSQVTLALESHLGTIREDPHINWAVLPLAHDPLQISRGPMRMEPSRKAPPPPPAPRHGSPTHLVLEHFGLESRKRLHKRSASNIHVATQMRYADTSKKRISSLFGSSTKANRVLGKTGGIEFTPVRMDREISSESNWSLSDSPHAYTNSNSPDMSPDEAPTPESDLSSIHDAAFEEVRRRLELLSPKDDPSLTFMAFHEKNASRSSVSITIVPNEQARAAACGEIHDHIAELEALEARRGPSPVELEATESSPRVELNAVPNSPINPRTLPGLIQELVASSADPSPKELLSIQGVHDSRSVRCRSLASLAMSEIPEMYASLPSPKPTYRPSLTAEELEQLISADAAERVLFRILHNLDNLQDLFAAATVSRGFYRTFKRHELPLIQNALWSMSPAAWELRQMSLSDPNERDTHKSSSTRPKDCAALYLQHYMRDMYTMIALKSMILEHCQTFLRADTITALAGGESERSPQLDDAFWRVWSFCKLFGCGKNREDDIVGQMDWLRGGALAKQQGRDTNTLSVVDNVAMNSVLFNPPTGFARGNGNGLTAEELYDMTEIWTCLGVLVRGFHGKREEAREFGIFESANIAPGDVEKEDATLGMSSIPCNHRNHELIREQRNGRTTFLLWPQLQSST